MNWLRPSRILLIASLAMPAFGTVTVNSPSQGGGVNSPVNYVASSSSSCSKGVASMGVYVDNNLQTVVNGNQMNTNVTISEGNHKTVVQEWDYCGGSTYQEVDITVGGGGGKSQVTVNAPANGGTVGSPVNYVASSTSTCAKGVASMGIYVNNTLSYVAQGASLNTNLSLNAGSYHTVVEEWDHCGGAAYTDVDITVSGGGGGGGGGQFTELQGSKGWIAYGEYPPNYQICTNCGEGVKWSITQHQSSPSLSGNSTEYWIGGNHAYSDVLFTIPLIGTNSSQGMPDTDHKIVPSVHDFTYDVYFYGSNLGLSEVLEFDINQFFDGMGFIYGHQCEITAGAHDWDIWDNVNKHWVHTGIACNPVSNGWNHLTIEVERTSNNELLYKTITFNGTTHTINATYPHYDCGDWYGIGLNYQMDGNSKQNAYSVYVDELTLTYQ